MEFSPNCPSPPSSSEQVELAHGEGGRRWRELLRQIGSWLEAPQLSQGGDAAVLGSSTAPVALTCDSYVVSPLFFPGGDIGTLAVNGTINDLSVAGARPVALSLSLILEEGLSLATLQKVPRECGGDGLPKWSSRRHGRHKSRASRSLRWDVPQHQRCRTRRLGPPWTGVITSRRSVADHRSAWTSRHCSDGGSRIARICHRRPHRTALHGRWPVVAALHEANIAVKAMRDATRGGVSAVLHEWAASCGQSLVIETAEAPGVTGHARRG